MIDRIKELCIEKNTNIKQLEKELHFANGTIRKWETQKATAIKLYAVAKYFNVSMEYLLTGRDKEGYSYEEKKLIDLYRSADPRGRSRIMNDAELEGKQETRSSSSKTG